MDTLTRFNSAAEQQLVQALTQSLGNMELATRIAQVALRELDGIYVYSVREVALTLQIADDIVLAARQAKRITPAIEAALAHHTEAYLTDMLHITHAAGEQLAMLFVSRS